MLHIVAFIVIGLVVGYFVGQGSQKGMTVIVILGLIGGLAGGYALLGPFAYTTAIKYGSLVTSIIGALVLGYIGKALSGKQA